MSKAPVSMRAAISRGSKSFQSRLGRDARRAALAAFDQADHGQLLDRLAHNGPADVELGRELLLGRHRLAGLDLAADDASDEGVADPLRQGRGAQCDGGFVVCHGETKPFLPLPGVVVMVPNRLLHEAPSHAHRLNALNHLAIRLDKVLGFGNLSDTRAVAPCAATPGRGPKAPWECRGRQGIEEDCTRWSINPDG